MENAIDISENIFDRENKDVWKPRRFGGKS